MRSIFTLVLATVALTSYSQTQNTVIGNAKYGNDEGWVAAQNWSEGRIPGNGDIVVIPNGQTITVKGQPYTIPASLTIRINGTLAFEPSGKLDLSSTATIQLFSGGKITSNNTNSEVITINGVVKYRGGIDPSPLNGPAFASAATGVSGTSATGFGFGVLPVKLKSFTALAQGTRVNLKWTTAEEINTSNFVIEKSTNAHNWSPILTVQAKGEAADYAASDNVPANGDNFYRLMSVDLDGKTQYSNVIKVVRGKSLSAHISPNPATGHVTVSLSTASAAPIQLQLVNNSGQVVRQRLYAKGTSLADLGLLGTARGIYTLLLRDGSTVIEASQLLVQ